MKRILLLVFIIPVLVNSQTTIYASGMIDVNKGKYVESVTVVVNNGKIEEITTGKPPAGTNYINLDGYTLLPCLIDCHTHLTGNWYEGYPDFDEYSLPAAFYGILGVVNAKKTLEAGFTTVRDVHAHFYSDVALRDAINKGIIPGPRMFVTGSGLSITGGHGAWGNWLSPQLELKENPGSVADGEVEVMKETRKHLIQKVDWIKIFATGGFGSYGTIPGATSYSEEEMRAAVMEADKLGIPVAAHAHGKEGIINALNAGVKSIEHATFLNQECIDLIKEKDAFLSMDLYAGYYEWFVMNNSYDDKEMEGTTEEQYAEIERRFKLAVDNGVKMVFSTDAGVYPHGQNTKQFKLMINAGMSHLGAIKSATIIAADLLGMKENLGSIEEGKIADLIAVKGNPLDNIAILEEVVFVMKEGEVVKALRTQ
ncbi:amidohydrolase family protein [Ekhidna sp.]|uniref:metal-dependent hydrolase family protein n=1 Tax=Ekhidna sp. TaxID=2608089 RepID=UPI003B5B1C6B